MTTILVTGGAGYIGSQVARQLGERGEKLVTLDNLSTGFRGAVLLRRFRQGDTGDAALVSRLLAEHKVDTVLHFAAHIQVPESVRNPAQVLPQQHGEHAHAPRVLQRRRREALRLFLDGRRLRHPGGRRRG
jgi:UDP-glucose 4-epimerase